MDSFKQLVQSPSAPLFHPSRKSRRPSYYASGLTCLVLLISIYALYCCASLVCSTAGFCHTDDRALGNISFPSLFDATLDDLRLGLDSGAFTSIQLVHAYTARIQETQHALNSVTELNPAALSIAAALDAERDDGFVRGPLHGIPILLKDNISTADKMNNTAGSFALLGAKVPADSTIARKLRNAGAIILGKTNLSEWANCRSHNSSNGWSAYGGQTYAAYYPNQDPSGSSSGSAVASSLGLASAALGTETAGSIIMPSSFNNLVGIKPSVGLTSRYLVVPVSEHQDTVGPMTRTVKDGAIILSAIAGVDENDNYTSAIPFKEKLPDYVAACHFHALQGKRIGIPRNAIRAADKSHPVLQAFESALAILEDAGATIVDNANYTAIAEYGSRNTTSIVALADFASSIAEYLSILSYNPTGIKDIKSIRNFTMSYPSEEYPDRDTKSWDAIIDMGFNNTSPEFWEAYQTNQRIFSLGGIPGVLKNHSLDALIVPSAFGFGGFDISATLGLPIINVPLGAYPQDTPIQYNDRGDLVNVAPNIPFGISFLGDKFTEELLIGLAYAFEQRTRVRDKVLPYIQPETELEDVLGSKLLMA